MPFWSLVKNWERIAPGHKGCRIDWRRRDNAPSSGHADGSEPAGKRSTQNSHAFTQNELRLSGLWCVATLRPAVNGDMTT